MKDRRQERESNALHYNTNNSPKSEANKQEQQGYEDMRKQGIGVASEVRQHQVVCTREEDPEHG